MPLVSIVGDPHMQLHTELLFVNLGVPELTIIFVLVLLLFGPGKLPQVMRSLGEGFRQFKSAANGVTKDLETPHDGDDPKESRP